VLEREDRHRSHLRPLSRAGLVAVVVTLLAVGTVLAGVTGTFVGLGSHRQNVHFAPNQPPGGQRQIVAAPTEVIRPGQVAAKLPLAADDHLGVAGTVTAGDYVVVIAMVSTELFGSKDPVVVTRSVFTGIEVIRVSRPEPDSRIEGALIVWMWDCDVRYLAWLTHHAELRYTLMSFAPSYSTLIGSDVQPGCDPNSALPAAVDVRWHISNSA